MWDIGTADPLVEPRRKNRDGQMRKGVLRDLRLFYDARLNPRGKDVTKSPSTPTPLRRRIPLGGCRQSGLGVIQRCCFSSSGQMGRNPR